MKNFLEYFYNIKITEFDSYDTYISFYYNGYKYRMYITDDINFFGNINFAYNISLINRENSLISEIIKNRNNEIVTTYNSNNYILLKIYVNENKSITLSEINYLSNYAYNYNLNIDYGILWSNKIDYLEELINENGKKYPLIVDSFNYFVGLAENAISYLENANKLNNYKYVISHKHIKINDTTLDIYNPFNIIFDYKIRDISEYIKFSFFNNNFSIFKELNTYLSKTTLSFDEVILLIARTVYPSFYFDMYEDILVFNKNESIIMDIIKRINDYEIYLNDVINYFSKLYDIPQIEWLKK